MGTPTLADFLLARIAEDEDAATTYRLPQGVTISKMGLDVDGLEWNCEWITNEESRSRCEPVTNARVLAECEAKQRIVEEHRPGPAEHEIWCLTCLSAGSFPCPTLRALASVYADHPDYREEWA